MKKDKLFRISGLFALSAVSLMLCSAMPAHAEETELRRAEDYILYDNYGNAYCMQDNTVLTGKFSLQPNYLMGDVAHDGEIDSVDAATILSAAASAGSSTQTTEEILAIQFPDMEDAEQIRFYADINQDNVINAIDSACILSYAVSSGSGTDTHPMGFAYYYADQDGTLQTGFIQDEQTGEIYYANADYQLVTGWLTLDGQEYYFDEEGVLREGTVVIDKQETSGGWQTDADQNTYYLDEDGTRHTGWLEEDGKIYRFDENGILITSQQASNGSYDENGVFTKKAYPISDEVRNMLDNAVRSPRITHIDVKNRQNGLPYTTDPDLKNGITFRESDFEIIEAFADEHFSPDMTLSECLYETWWWIHCNVDYAYAGEKWNAIVNKTYPDAVFNARMGQCVQYNGAMAAVLAYYGFDVYMVKGWTNPPANTSQHYWTEVMIDGSRYYVETGNQGKNGDYWQYFFENAENVSYTKSN